MIKSAFVLLIGQLNFPLVNGALTDVAVKVLKEDMSTKSMRDDFEREVKTISSFDHENILRLIGVVIVGTRLQI